MTEINIKKITYSKEVGEEGNKISAQATTLTTKYGYNNQDVEKKVFLLLKDNIQAGYVLPEEMTSYKINKIEKKNDLLKLNVSVVGKSIKNISKNEIIQLSKGSNVKNVGTVLKTKFNIQGVNIKNSDPLPVLNTILPFFPNNISVSISSL